MFINVKYNLIYLWIFQANASTLQAGSGLYRPSTYTVINRSFRRRFWPPELRGYEGSLNANDIVLVLLCSGLIIIEFFYSRE